ncbi:MAG: AtpZ/AtpI family protein [Desulfatibacillaceae bacterium]
MPDRQPESRKKKEEFASEVAKKERRKMRARGEDRSPWFGFGMFGLVGWAVSIPTVVGVAIGVWLDGRYPGRISWTLTFLFLGVALGCLNAWFWVKRESRK